MRRGLYYVGMYIVFPPSYMNYMCFYLLCLLYYIRISYTRHIVIIGYRYVSDAKFSQWYKRVMIRLQGAPLFKVAHLVHVSVTSSKNYECIIALKFKICIIISM